MDYVGKVANTPSKSQHFRKARFGLSRLFIITKKQRSRTWVDIHQKRVEKSYMELMNIFLSCKYNKPATSHVPIPIFICKMLQLRVENINSI